MKIDGTIELIKSTSNSLSTGDRVSIIVSIIALLGVVTSTIITVCFNKKNSKDRNNFEEKQNKKLIKHQEKIDETNRIFREEIEKDNRVFQEQLQDSKIKADLVAQSRIDWIQKVRESTAKLIASYGKLTNEREREEYLVTLNDIRINSEILKLYFGSKKHLSSNTEISDEEKNMIILEDSNEGKNNLIVKYINYLVNEYIRENSKNTFEKKMRLQNLLMQIKEELVVAAGFENEYVSEDIFYITNFIKEDDESYSHNIILSKEDILDQVEDKFKLDGIDTDSEEVEAVLDYISKKKKNYSIYSNY